MHGFASYNINLMMYASYNIQFISHCNSWFFQTRHCTVVGGRVTASMLMSDASFSGTVSNHGGKGLVSVLRKEAGKLGYGGIMKYLCCVLGRIVPDGQWEVVGGLDCYIC
jgi:hypothetical protein